MYPRLLTVDTDGKKQPYLAKKFGYLNPTTGYWDIRDDMKWSDGQKVTASDVAYTINAILRCIRKTFDPTTLHAIWDKLLRGFRKLQLSQFPLHGDLPGTDRRQQQRRLGVFENVQHGRELLRRRLEPEKRMGVEQNCRHSKSARTSGDSGALKSSGTSNLPRSCPNCRLLRCTIGTSRATGRPPE